MATDWPLVGREDYSGNCRRAACRPRIDRACEAPKGDGRLRVAFIARDELARRGAADRLDLGLRRIGRRLAGGALVPAGETVRELFFPQGPRHDACARIGVIICQARQSLRLVDPYLDGTAVAMPGDAQGTPTAELLGAKPPAGFDLETERFRQRRSQMQVRTRISRDLHDRFIVIGDKAYWRIGCSIKDVGNRAFTASMIEDSRNAEALLETLLSAWAGTTPFA